MRFRLGGAGILAPPGAPQAPDERPRHIFKLPFIRLINCENYSFYSDHIFPSLTTSKRRLHTYPLLGKFPHQPSSTSIQLLAIAIQERTLRLPIGVISNMDVESCLFTVLNTIFCPCPTNTALRHIIQILQHSSPQHKQNLPLTDHNKTDLNKALNPRNSRVVFSRDTREIEKLSKRIRQPAPMRRKT